MREFLFRGKRTDCSEWLYGQLIIDNDKAHHIYVFKQDILGDVISGLRYVNEDTVGQYTGLKDKNGTKIFEGDILRISIKDSDDKIEYKLGVVEFSTRSLEYIIRSKEGLVYGFNSILNSAGLYEFRLEVIGNIYKNRNLLK